MRYNLTSRTVREWYRDDLNTRFVYCEMLPRIKKVVCIDDVYAGQATGIMQLHVFNALSLKEGGITLTLNTGFLDIYMNLLAVETSTGLAVRKYPF
jgi:hypothetical protein